MKVRPYLEFKRLGRFLAWEIHTPCGSTGHTRMCGVMVWGKNWVYARGTAKLQHRIEWFMPDGWFLGWRP